MGLDEKMPLELMKQDPESGLYKLGGIEMTPSEYTMALQINEIKEELVNIKERLSKVEGK